MINRITAQCEALQYENHKILMENSLLADAASAAEMALCDFKLRKLRDRDILTFRIQELESKCLTLTSQIKKHALDVQLIANLVAPVSIFRTAPTKRNMMQAEESEMAKRRIREVSELALRRGRVASIALASRRTAQIQARDS